jgi:release factor glutamine methyltransferase
VTVLEVIQRSTDFLGKRGVDSPRLHAELLLASVLKVPRMRLYLNFEQTLTEAELESCRGLVKRRGQREPLQYILGSTSFCGLELEVNKQVLVPRPETELLAERGWTFLTDFGAPQGQGPAALDFGTGSGCLAVALAVKCPTVRVDAVDASPEALALAAQNASRHSVADRICFLQGEDLSVLPAQSQYQLVVSNPPYIPSAEIAALEPEVKDWEPRTALDGGPDGLEFYRLLAQAAPAALAPGGKIMLELGDGEAESVCDIFQKQKWIVESVLEDYTHRPRIFIGRRD